MVWYGDHGGARDMFFVSNGGNCNGFNNDANPENGRTASHHYRCCR